MIVVTGATGQLGREIVKELLKRVPAHQVGASVRDPAKAADLSSLGIRVRRGDFDDGKTLEHAFEGATQVLVVSSNARASGGDPLVQHRTGFEAARAAGARRIVYTSHIAASPASAFPPARDHAASEDILRNSGLAWTTLRHGFYAQSGVMLMGDAFILANEGRFDGPTPPLTGAEALDMADLATIASELQGCSISRKTLTDDDLRAKMVARGVPDGAVAIALGLYLASRNGEFATIDPALEQMLGRPAIRMRAFMAGRIGG